MVLHIQPPPAANKDRPPLYRVVYAIDLPAANPQQAARLARQIMADPASLPPVLQVIDSQGTVTTIDLAERPAESGR